MKTTCTFEVLWSTWSDPGDYPNALAARPLRCYDYPEEINGALTVELEPSETMLSDDALCDLAQDYCPWTVFEWAIDRSSDRTATVTVVEFDRNQHGEA